MKDIFGKHIPEKPETLAGVRDQFVKSIGADSVLERLIRMYVGWAYTYRNRRDIEWWRQQFISIKLITGGNIREITTIFKTAYNKKYGVLVHTWQVKEALRRSESTTVADNKYIDEELLSDTEVSRIRGKK